MNRLLLALSPLVLFLALAGCEWFEGKKVPSASDVQRGATNAMETIRQISGAAGKIDVQLENGRFKSAGCYARLYLLSDGRPNILQITSYPDATAEKFPSVFIRAQVAQSSPGALATRRVEAQQVYVQAAAEGPIWKSPDGQTVLLSITNIDGNQIEATLTGVLIDVVSGESTSLSAKLVGEFEQPRATDAVPEVL